MSSSQETAEIRLIVSNMNSMSNSNRLQLRVGSTQVTKDRQCSFMENKEGYITYIFWWKDGQIYKWDKVDKVRLDYASPTEARVSAAFHEVLGLDEGTIGRTTSFFEAGGDSTLAVALIGKLQSSVSDAISLLDLFEEPTVSGLSTRLVPNECIVWIHMRERVHFKWTFSYFGTLIVQPRLVVPVMISSTETLDDVSGMKRFFDALVLNESVSMAP